MDCLFTDSESAATINYIKELKARGFEPIVYAGPHWDVFGGSWTRMIPWEDDITDSTEIENGLVGNYYGAQVYMFDGLDEHTCCVLPNFNNIKPF